MAELTPEKIAEEVNQAIVEADREAMKSHLAFATGHFQKYWDGYVAKARQGLEETYNDLRADSA